jgi:hypothetical protein
MCKIKVTLAVSNQHDKERAIGKLRNFPHVDEKSISHSRNQVAAIIDHPEQLTTLQAASWAKDQIGMDPRLQPGAQVLD